MIPLGINNKIYTNSKTRYRTNIVTILILNKTQNCFVSLTEQFFYTYTIGQKKTPLKYNKPPSKKHTLQCMGTTTP